MIPWLVLVRILVTLASGIYKGEQGPSQNKIIRLFYTQGNTNHHTGRRVLRTSRPEPVYVLCSLHLRVPDLSVSSPKTYHLGHIPQWVAGKTPTAGAQDRGAH
jgi:hypothetical protein